MLIVVAPRRSSIRISQGDTGAPCAASATAMNSFPVFQYTPGTISTAFSSMTSKGVHEVYYCLYIHKGHLRKSRHLCLFAMVNLWTGNAEAYPIVLILFSNTYYGRTSHTSLSP